MRKEEGWKRNYEAESCQDCAKKVVRWAAELESNKKDL